MSNTALVVTTQDYPIDFAISAWLHAKTQRSHSERTQGEYQTTLDSFRRFCRAAGYDLDGPTRELATLAQAWAARRRPGRGEDRPVSPATLNLRLSVVSSFYRYARRMGHLSCDNPIDRLERAPVQSYAAATPLAAAYVAERMAIIPTSSPSGRRDKALLAIALATGRRLSEVAGMRVGDVSCAGGGHANIVWRRLKGGKVMADTLPVGPSALLHAYMKRDRAGADADSPVWISYSGPRSTRGQALGRRSCERVCARRLGVSKFHATRHTFAHVMEDAGAKVSDIQARLGHASLAVTGRYLAALRSSENTHGEAVAAALGLG